MPASEWGGSEWGGTEWAGDGSTSAPTTTISRGVPQILISFDGTPLDPTTWNWVDVTAYADAEISIERGRSNEFDEPAAGSASFRLRNDQRRFDALHTAGPYFGKLKPRRPCQINMIVGTSTFTLFTGFVHRWPQRFDDRDRSYWVTVRATDLLGILQAEGFYPARPFTWDDPDLGLFDANNLYVGTPSFDDVHRAGSRITALLTRVGVPTSLLDLDAGLSLLAAGEVTSETIGEELALITQTELGELYCAADGRLTFVQRHGWSARPQMAADQLTLSDDLTVTSAGPYVGLAWDADDERLIINEVTRKLPNGLERRARSHTSRLERGLRSRTIDTIHASVDEAKALAQWQIDRYAGAQLRIEQVSLNPEARPDVLWPAVCALDLGARVLVKHRPQNVGAEISQACRIIGIRHELRGLDLETTWQLTSVDPTSYLRFDDPTLGLLDTTNKWAP